MNAIFRTACCLFLLFLASGLHAQTGNYEAQWKEVDQLIRKNRLPKSAMEGVKKIYAQAKKQGRSDQLIKALVYMNSLQEETREDNDLLSISEVEKEIA